MSERTVSLHAESPSDSARFVVGSRDGRGLRDGVGRGLGHRPTDGPGRGPAARAHDRAFGWLLIVSGVLAIAALYVLFVLSTTGQAIDNRIMYAALVNDELGDAVLSFKHYLGPMVMAPIAFVIAACGLLRGWRVAAGAAAGVVVCLVLPQVLKAVLPRPQLADPWPMVNSLPSGHTAAVAAVGVALLVVLPRTYRSLALFVGLVPTLVMGLFVLVLGHHRVSDVIASLCVAAIGWGVALLVQSARFAPEHPRA